MSVPRVDSTIADVETMHGNDAKQREFVREWASILLKYNMNLSMQTLTAAQRTSLEKIVAENSTASSK